MRSILAFSLLFAPASAFAQSSDILVQWLPAAGAAAASEYNNSGQTPLPTFVTNGAVASPLSRVNQAVIANGGAVWPGYIANFQGEAGLYDVETGGYTEFTLEPEAGESLALESIAYPLNSYGGMNDADGYTGVVRTSVDAFASELASVTITNAGAATFTFDISALGTISEAVTFRIYFVDNAGPNTWADLGTTGGGLVVSGISSVTEREESVTWTSATSDFWQIGGPDANWNSSDSFFQNGDAVTFDDSVDPLFSGTVTVEGLPVVTGITVDNTEQNYVLAGRFGGEGVFTKNGSATLELALTQSLPFVGPLNVNEGLVALSGTSTALDNITVLTVGENGVFRFVAGSAGQDTMVPIVLSGGTLEVDDGMFTWPQDANPVTLAAGTTSTIDNEAGFSIYANELTGDGNLIKTGPGTLNAASAYAGITDLLTYTGTTELREGVFPLARRPPLNPPIGPSQGER